MGEGGKRKGRNSVLNPLMFIGGHIANEHMGVHVCPAPLCLSV
jgi:hypothetical protein